MSFTTPNEFPVLKALLLEDDDDITAGLRQVLGDIKSRWGGIGRSTDKMRDSSLKKLSPAQRTKVNEQVHAFFDAMLNDLSRPPNYAALVKSLGTADEAMAIAAVMAVIANPTAGKIQYLTQLFINASEQRAIIDADEADRMARVIKSDTDRMPSPDVLDFFKHNAMFFKKVLDLDQNLGIDPDAGANLLNRKLAATENSNAGSKKDAVIRTCYGLQRIRLYCGRVVDMLKTEAASRKPDDKLAPGGSPTKDAHPAANPAAGKPTASMTPTAAAPQPNSAAAGPANQAAASTEDNSADITAALVQLGYTKQAAAQAVAKLPKGISSKDGVKQALRAIAPK